MSSPIHKYLFSPPPSPPTRHADIKPKHRPPPLVLNQAPIAGDTTGSTAISTPTLVPRSPRTPQNRFEFTLNDKYPSPSPGTVTFPTRTPKSAKDLESGIYATPTQTTPRIILHEPSNTPRQTTISSKVIMPSPPLLPANIPTTPLSHPLTAPSITLPTGLPKPLLRLLFLITLIGSSVLLLLYIPSTRLPSLHEASTSRRLALAEDGRAFLDVINPVKGWSEARDRDYVPAQIKSSKMFKRSAIPEPEPIVERSMVPPHPKASKPTPPPRPIPESHELLALQSYLLASTYNTLPNHFDAQKPLDANVVLGFGGEMDSMLEEIEREGEDEVVVWFGVGDSTPSHPHDLLTLLAEIHGPNRQPTLLPLHSRPDRTLLASLLNRLNISTSKPLIMIGNTPFTADLATLKQSGGMEGLKGMMKSIGWCDESPKGKGKEEWKPKYAKVVKREITEVQEALREIKFR